MMSLRLWRAMNTPLLKQYAFLAPSPPDKKPAANPSNKVLFGIALLLILIAPGMIGGFVVVLVIGFLTAPISSAYRSIQWMTRTVGDLTRMRAEGSYELLAMTPFGALGVSWITYRGVIYRGDMWQRVHKYRFQFIGIALMTFLGGGLIALLSEGFSELPTLLAVGFYILIAILFYVLDFVQSLSIGCLLAMLIPAYSQRQFDARMAATGIFLLLHISTYLLVIFVNLLIFVPLFTPGPGDLRHPVLAVLHTLLAILLFYTTREIITRLLLRQVSEHLNTTSVELDALTRGAL